ncbi:MAG: hypothetical protein A2W25_00325 [candidate division Zixibacteria bacterium RBG_16_53_22]|nr:MAG: hypothetical protein A2W25_00325 [candidate division Zixibacteria bacterium RBG_16_53_22]
MQNDGNVAFKCTYHDGPNSPFGIGFFDVCTKENIIRNIEAGRIQCCNSNCAEYYESDFENDEPSFPCYESDIFAYWQFASGWYQTGKKHMPIQMNDAREGKIAVMTTRPPRSTEEERRIFAIMYISRVDPSTDKSECWVHFDPYKSIALKREEWLDFWDFYSTETGDIIWGTGLFRYMSDREVKKILRAVSKIRRFKRRLNPAEELLRKLEEN